jgi:transposase
MMIGACMKRDGRKLDHGTLEEIRKMAIELVREGERPSTVIASHGLHRCVIYRWMKAAAKRGKGVRKAWDVRPS